LLDYNKRSPAADAIIQESSSSAKAHNNSNSNKQQGINSPSPKPMEDILSLVKLTSVVPVTTTSYPSLGSSSLSYKTPTANTASTNRRQGVELDKSPVLHRNFVIEDEK
jgi:hypothetical protein